jgi:hypothetical protein
MHEHKGMISIWYFIGILLLIYGVLILAASSYDAVYPPANPVVLESLHAGIYWGVLLLIIGGVYVARFRPRRTR